MRTSGSQKPSATERLHNRIVELIVEEKARAAEALYVLELIKHEILESTSRAIFSGKPRTSAKEPSKTSFKVE